MGIYRRIEVGIWNDPKFAALSLHGKLVFLHAFANAHGNVSGVYAWNARRVASETGLTIAEVREEIVSPAMAALVVFDPDEELVFVRSMFKIQGSGQKLDTCALANVSAMPLSSPCVRAFADKYPHVGGRLAIPHPAASGIPYPAASRSPIPVRGRGEVEVEVEGTGEGERTGEGEGGQRISPLTAGAPVARADARPPSGPSPEDVAETWQRECPELPVVRLPLAVGVRKAIAAAVKRERGRDWTQTFRRVAASPWCSGLVPGNGGREPFVANLVWLLEGKNLAKLDAGGYDLRPDRGSVTTARISNLRKAIDEGFDRAARTADLPALESGDG